MKLAVSNIAWDPEEESDVLEVLKGAGIPGLEIAPTKLWPDWSGATVDAAKKAAERYAELGFSIPALQAILFGRPDLKVFGDKGDRAAFVEHIDNVAKIAAGLGASIMVFGSPRNRDPGAMSFNEAMSYAVDVFKEVGERCAKQNVSLGIEANPADYDCRFVTRWNEAAELVRRCNSPGVRLHLDAACTELAGDDLADAVAATTDILAHVHISEPQLGTFDGSLVEHAKFGAALKSTGYTGWCSIEMRRAENPLAAIEGAVAMALDHYD